MEEKMQSTEDVGQLVTTVSDMETFGLIYLAAAVYFMLRGASTFRKRGESGMKGAFLSLVIVTLLFSIVFIIVATLK